MGWRDVTCLFFFVAMQTREAKRVLGNYYREPRKSGPVPIHLIPTLMKSLNRDHYVSDNGDIVYYETDYKLSPIKPKKI